MKKLKPYCRTLLLVLLVLVTLGFHDEVGKWVEVRRADWNFWLTRVVFWDEQHGFVKGLHRELLITADGGQTWNL